VLINGQTLDLDLVDAYQEQFVLETLNTILSTTLADLANSDGQLETVSATAQHAALTKSPILTDLAHSSVETIKDLKQADVSLLNAMETTFSRETDFAEPAH
jgi:hypothetical protein